MMVGLSINIDILLTNVHVILQLVECSLKELRHNLCMLKNLAYIFQVRLFQSLVKARLHRRFLSQQLNAIFVAPKLHRENRRVNHSAISARF